MRKMAIWGRLWPVFLLFCLTAAWARQKQSAKSPHPEDPATLRVTSRLVEVNVIVLDRNGLPVRGLTKDDFEVYDEGQRQVLREFLQAETPSHRAASAIPAPAALPPNTFANAGVTREAGTLSVVLFDELNTRIQDKLYARNRILKFLGTARPQDRLAVYLLSDRVRVLHDFTSDAAALSRIVARQTGNSAQTMGTAELDPDVTGYELVDAFVEDAARRQSNEAIRNRVRTTLQAVEWIARRLRPTAGRKNLIWVSGGFPLSLGFDPRRPGDTSFRDQATFHEQAARATRALNEANVAIYPIDARGLLTDPMDPTEQRNNEPSFISGRSTLAQDRFGSNAGDQDQSRGGSTGGQQPGQQGGQGGRRLVAPPPVPLPISSNSFRKLDATIDAMILLADLTGGRAFYNSNDIEGALRATLEESEVSYRLAFEPTHDKWDGSLRQIKVRLKREGYHLRHRQGYLALPDTTPDAQKELLALRDVAASPAQIGELPLRAEVSAAAQELRVRVFVDLGGLVMGNLAGNWKGSVDVYFETANETGAPVWGDARRVPYSLSSAQHDAALRTGLPISKTVPRAAEARQLRVAIRDSQSGAVGTLRILLDQLK